MKFSIKDFFSKCNQILSFLSSLQIWLHLVKKSLMENFIFCAVYSYLLETGTSLTLKLKQTLNIFKQIYFEDLRGIVNRSLLFKITITLYQGGCTKFQLLRLT